MAIKLKSGYVFLIFLFISFKIDDAFSQINHYSTQNFIFPTLDGKYILNGTLSIPFKEINNNKCIILIAPPFSIDRSYFGFFSVIADSLSKKGYTVMRFDNRNYTYKDFGFRMSMHIQSDDAQAAFNALKNDLRFKNMEIGLLGHSEGAAAISIAVTKNIKVDFCILLSPMGLNGDIITNNQRESVAKRINGLLPIELIEKINHNNRELIKIIKKESDTLVMKQMSINLITDFYNKNPEIIILVNRYTDSLRIKQKNNVLQNNYPVNLDSLSIVELFKKEYYKMLNDGHIDFIKYEPEFYFSKIKSPLLIIYGDKDDLIEPKSNSENIKNILGKSSNCFEIIILKDVNHDFRRIDGQFKPEVTADLFRSVDKWIKNVYPFCNRN